MDRTSDSYSGLRLAGRRLRLPNGNNVEPEGPDLFPFLQDGFLSQSLVWWHVLEDFNQFLIERRFGKRRHDEQLRLEAERGRSWTKEYAKPRKSMARSRNLCAMSNSTRSGDIRAL